MTNADRWYSNLSIVVGGVGCVLVAYALSANPDWPVDEARRQQALSYVPSFLRGLVSSMVPSGHHGLWLSDMVELAWLVGMGVAVRVIPPLPIEPLVIFRIFAFMAAAFALMQFITQAALNPGAPTWFNFLIAALVLSSAAATVLSVFTGTRKQDERDPLGLV